MSIKRILKNVILMGMMLICLSCNKTSRPNVGEIITINAKPTVEHLYYSDFIKPIRTIPVRNTEADGIVLEKTFEYGKNVKEGELLFVIFSEQLSKNFFDAVRQYVRSAQALATAQYQMEGEEYLNKLKIVSQQEYNSVKAQLFNAKLDYADALSRLTKSLKEEGTDTSILNKLQSKNPETIYDTLTKLPKTNLFEAFAPRSGISLMPSAEGNESKKPLLIGSLVKSGQELVSIGDMSGISITVSIPENYIDKIKEGQKAIITGDAFHGISIEGTVISVGRQSISTGSSSVPSYNVTMIAPKISIEAQKIIRVGMSANVEFRLESLPIINIPLTAVFMKEGKAYVKKMDAKSGKVVLEPVETGRTGLDSVEITCCLKDKDKVVLNASSD